MANFTPVDEANPTLADIARGLNAVHRCVDGFRKEQSEFNVDIKTQQDVDSGRITKLAQMFGAEKMEPGEKRPKGHGIATWAGWKTISILGGCVGLFVFGFQMFVAIAPAAYAYIMSLHP